MISKCRKNILEGMRRGSDSDGFVKMLIYPLILHSFIINRLYLGNRESAVDTPSKGLSQGRTWQTITR